MSFKPCSSSSKRVKAIKSRTKANSSGSSSAASTGGNATKASKESKFSRNVLPQIILVSSDGQRFVFDKGTFLYNKIDPICGDELKDGTIPLPLRGAIMEKAFEYAAHHEHDDIGVEEAENKWISSKSYCKRFCKWDREFINMDGNDVIMLHLASSMFNLGGLWELTKTVLRI